MLTESLKNINLKIKDAAIRTSRDSHDIKLIAVSKYQPVAEMQSYIDLLTHNNYDFSPEIIFGESYVQEWKEKQSQLNGNFKVHLIGALQSNKIKEAVKLFDIFESVHKIELLEKINNYAEKNSLIIKTFLQVNISNDENKSGFGVNDVIPYLEHRANQLSNIRLAGLMTITRFYEQTEDVRSDFQAMKKLYNEVLSWIQSKYSYQTDSFDLSMGMSDDYEIAIEEGATMVRIGSALFGERQ